VLPGAAQKRLIADIPASFFSKQFGSVTIGEPITSHYIYYKKLKRKHVSSKAKRAKKYSTLLFCYSNYYFPLLPDAPTAYRELAIFNTATLTFQHIRSKLL